MAAMPFFVRLAPTTGMVAVWMHSRPVNHAHFLVKQQLMVLLRADLAMLILLMTGLFFSISMMLRVEVAGRLLQGGDPIALSAAGLV